MGFQVAGCRDYAEGRKEFLRELERIVYWGNPTQAELVFFLGAKVIGIVGALPLSVE